MNPSDLGGPVPNRPEGAESDADVWHSECPSDPCSRPRRGARCTGATGSFHGGSMHGGTGSFHGGSMHGGTGSFHGGSMHGGTGSFHGGSMHGGTGSFRGGSMHGGTGSFHGGSMHGDFHRDFGRGFHRDFDSHGHNSFHHGHNDFHGGLGFGYYPYGYWYYYPYGSRTITPMGLTAIPMGTTTVMEIPGIAILISIPISISRGSVTSRGSPARETRASIAK